MIRIRVDRGCIVCLSKISLRTQTQTQTFRLLPHKKASHLGGLRAKTCGRTTALTHMTSSKLELKPTSEKLISTNPKTFLGITRQKTTLCPTENIRLRSKTWQMTLTLWVHTTSPKYLLAVHSTQRGEAGSKSSLTYMDSQYKNPIVSFCINRRKVESSSSKLSLKSGILNFKRIKRLLLVVHSESMGNLTDRYLN